MSVIFVDIEVDPENEEILDYGAVNLQQDKIHTKSEPKFRDFIKGYEFICGHNIIHHDSKYISDTIDAAGIQNVIDTLYISPLTFPAHPYHALLKDEKILSDELNNPLSDAIKAKDLFLDEEKAFRKLDIPLQKIFYFLLYRQEEFKGFFKYLTFKIPINIERSIKRRFYGKICNNCNLNYYILHRPIELAYCLALINSENKYAIVPHWVHMKYPETENIMRTLRNTPCQSGCIYCHKNLNINIRLKDIFGYENFREYDGEPLQERAVYAAMQHKSLLSVFPTGGGKSLAFQLPALIAGESEKGLTIVISPLQSLMKDQVDSLSKIGIVDAVTINGLLNPIERAEAIERVMNGKASLLYIAPESLRSKTIERLLLSRNIVRFVIDEAHCFSAWGQDFRVDYLYIGKFISELQQKKKTGYSIPVSCFTATAKPKVISDIKEYFKEKLNINLELYTTSAIRTNLRYGVLYKETDEEKYLTLRDLIEERNCPTIIYTSRTKTTKMLAERLCTDHFSARPFNGKMQSSEKSQTQEDFINDKFQIIVATSAFGMGINKLNVGLVIHYDISDSLENYIQESGRAGRDESLNAECYILFNENDLNKHFTLLNQTKLSMNEIQQIWKAIKVMSYNRQIFSSSALEIANQAGWDTSITDIETRVRTALNALENSGYIRRGKNVPRIFANSITVHNMEEAASIIDKSVKLDQNEKLHAKRIVKLLISSRSIARAGNTEAESRIDYIADILGIKKFEVIRSIGILREEGVLSDSKDLTLLIQSSENKNKSLQVFKQYASIESFLADNINPEGEVINLKELNERALKNNRRLSTIGKIKTILYYWMIKNYIRKNINVSNNNMMIVPEKDFDKLRIQYGRRVDIAEFIINYLFDLKKNGEERENRILFSVLELKTEYEKMGRFTASQDDIEDALLYLTKIDALKIEGGFLVLYNAMEIERLERDNKIRYKKEDYKYLNEYYKQKIQQIHIVGEYAKIMTNNYSNALLFVNDYFNMNYKKFINKYFLGERLNEINRNITTSQYNRIIKDLSENQMKILEDNISQYIVVTAGPGSGKTRLLVHKLASLIMLEDIKHEQLLMLTFSRAAANEFKMRLYDLIGNAAAFIEVKTFHSYCFDLLGRIGNIEDSAKVVQRAVTLIQDGNVESGRITKSVVVVDEAQDMDSHEFALLEALIEHNEEMRLIAVGDDDQSIYEFRGADPKYLRSFITEKNAILYEMLENFRSNSNIVNFSNEFAKRITVRMKNNLNVPVKSFGGIVRLVKHSGRNLEVPLVDHLINTHTEGSVCVLTNTNAEALRVIGLLTKKGKHAQLIQSNDEFSLYDIMEIRFFLKKLGDADKNPIIDEETWKAARAHLQNKYKDSKCLTLCENMLNTFELSNRKKYRSDLDIFIRESRIEDFYFGDQDRVLVSTIHKSKGKEFDKVYMLLDHVMADTDEQKRKIYVGLTRAKNELYIHYNNDIFDNIKLEGIETHLDSTIYEDVEEMIIQLNYKDVYLDYFKDKKNTILNLYSGKELKIVGNRMYVSTSFGISPILQFSQKFINDLTKLKQSGYRPYKGEIRFILAWKKKDIEQEYAVVLPDIYLKRSF